LIIPKAPSHPRFNNGHWQFDKDMGKNSIGFIYVIRDKVLRRFYLGKKLYAGHGKLNKGVESNWKKYRSSSPVLKEHFKERPIEEFDFICIAEYRSKGGLSYAETWSLCKVEAPTTDEWYNVLINKVSWRVSEGVKDSHKERLTEVIKWGEFD